MIPDKDKSQLPVGAATSVPRNESATAAIRQQLIQLIGEDRFDLWFSDDDCLQVVEGALNVFAPSEFELQRIQNSFGLELRDSLNAVCGPEKRITYDVRAEKPKVSQTEFAVRVDTEPEELPKPKVLRKRNAGLEQFIFDESNRLAETASQQTLRQPGQFTPLFVYGPSGCGKTLLLESLVTEYRRRLNFGRCVMITSEQFTANFVHSLRGAGLPMFRRKYRDLDLLAIDDIQFLTGKQATMVEMQYTIDHLIRAGKQIIVSSDRPPRELTQLGEELSRRLTCGLSCPLQYPDEESRFKILRRMCAQRQISIPGTVLRFVASRISRDVRRLSGAINRLHADAIATGRKLTVEYAGDVLSDLFSITSNASSMAQIERAVCEVCRITSSELKSVSRTKRLSGARMLAMWQSREYTSNAYSEIGDFFGGRTHSTVIAAGKRVKGWIGNNEKIDLPNSKSSAREIIQRIESKLGVG